MSSLCTHCHNGMHFVRRNRVERMYCGARADTIRVPHDIVTCSDFLDRRVPDRWDMEKIAWVLTPDQKGRPGFAPPKKED